MKLPFVVSFALISVCFGQPLSSFERDQDFRRGKSTAETEFRTMQKQPGLRKSDWETREECFVEDSSGECRTVENGTSCFGPSIPYPHSSTKHLEALNLLEIASDHGLDEYLARFKVFEGLPECWSSLRELLCGVFYPPCKDGRVLRVPRSVCVTAREKCSFLVGKGLWPDAFGDCSVSNVTSSAALDSIFTSGCRVSKGVVWKENRVCVSPLAYTDHNTGWVVDHCSLNCTAIRVESSDPIQGLLVFGLAVIFLLTILTMVLLSMRNKEVAFDPLRFWPLFWFLVSHAILSGCWLIQILSGAPTTCRDDQSIRSKEPSSAGGLWCIVQYVILLGSAITASLWIALFSCVHYIGRQRPISSSFRYSNLLVYAVSILMISCGLGFVQVDGDPVLSVCFVRKSSILGIVWYVMPLVLSSMISTVLFVLSVISVLKDSKRRSDVNAISMTANTPTLAQVGLLLITVLPCYMVSTAFAVADVFNWDYRQESIKEYVACQLGRHLIGGSSDCQFESIRNVRLAQFNVFLMCLPALLVDAWLFMCADISKQLRHCLSVGQRFICFCKKKPTTTKTINGSMSVRGDGQDGHEMELLRSDQRNQRLGRLGDRTSWNWSSSSSITDHEMHKSEGIRSFETRMKNRRACYREQVKSKSSLGLCSIKTPSSLESGPLPSSVSQMPSIAELPFPDLNKYPVMPVPSASSWWSPFGWPFAPPPWPWQYYQQSPPALNPSTGQVNSSVAIDSSTLDEQAAGNSMDGNVIAPPSGQSTLVGNADMAASMASNPFQPFYWPYPFPPFPPYWSPPVPVFSTPENQSTVGSATATSPTVIGAATSNAAASENEMVEDGRSKCDAGDVDIAKLSEDVDEEEEDSLSEEEEDLDSEDIDPEEELFAEEQLKSLLAHRNNSD